MTTRKHLDKIKDEVVFKPHQVEGVRILHRMQSYLLADEMRLGKSLQALTVAAIDFQQGIASRVLLVCPASLKWNWAEAEIEQHTLFTYLVLEGSAKKRADLIAQYVEDGTDILIVNYEQVGAHLDALNAIGFDIAIYDEAHGIKNRKAARTKSAMGLEARRHMLLTGSPLLNHVNDLWSLFYRIDPNLFPSYWRFEQRYCVYGGYKDKAIIGTKNSRELAAKLADISLRRERKDVLRRTGEEKEYQRIDVDFHPEQAKLYKQAKDELRIDLPNDPDPMELENALTKMLRLKQICGTTASIEGYADHSIKLDVAVERALELINNDENVVFFTQFRKVAECLVRRFESLKKAPTTFQLHGDVPMRDRPALIRRWDKAKPAVLVCGLKVGGVGLNMASADTCIFLDKLWAPKLNEQAEDRLISMEKDYPISVLYITIRGSVEQRIEQILKRKTALFGEIVQEDKWKRKLYEALMDEEEL